MTNYTTPPPAYPPPPAMGYPGQPGMPPMGKRGNGWAVASLVCGIVLCVPALTSLLAILFGIVGLRKARDPQTGGRGLALTGIILGVVGVLLWVVLTYVGVKGYRYVDRVVFKPAEQTGTAFVNSLTSGDVATARTHVTTDFPQADLDALAAQLKGLGPLRGRSLSNFKMDSEAGEDFRTEVEGTLRFDGTVKGFSAVFVGGEETGIKIKEFKLE